MEAPSESFDPGADADVEISPKRDPVDVPGSDNNRCDFDFTAQDIYASILYAPSIYYD